MVNENSGSTDARPRKTSKNSKSSRFQRPGSQTFPDEEAVEDQRWEKPRYQRPLSHEKNDARGEHHHYQRHSSNEEEQGRNQRRGKRPPVNLTQDEEVSEGAYEALKRQHQQLNYQPRNQEFREHDFRDYRGRRNRRFQRPYSRNGDTRRSFGDSGQDFSNGFQDGNHPQGESEFEPQAKRIHGGRHQRNENKGYDFSKSPLVSFFQRTKVMKVLEKALSRKGMKFLMLSIAFSCVTVVCM